jgi:hypothetical protein
MGVKQIGRRWGLGGCLGHSWGHSWGDIGWRNQLAVLVLVLVLVFVGGVCGGSLLNGGGDSFLANSGRVSVYAVNERFFRFTSL